MEAYGITKRKTVMRIFTEQAPMKKKIVQVGFSNIKVALRIMVQIVFFVILSMSLPSGDVVENPGKRKLNQGKMWLYSCPDSRQVMSIFSGQSNKSKQSNRRLKTLFLPCLSKILG